MARNGLQPTPSARPRETAIKLLRALRLNRVAARTYYKYVHGFASAVPELPRVVRRCIRRALVTGVAEQGDYYEFGVFKGCTFYHAERTARDLGLTRMRFYGFDSFQGLPPPQGPDATRQQHFYEGQYAWPLEQVEADLTRRGIEWSRSTLLPGYFEDTLNAATKAEHGMSKAAVVLVDSDLYESAVLVLDFVRDMLLDGSILIMDDWNAFDRDDTRGERRALREFTASDAGWRAEPWFGYGTYGQTFIVRPRRTARKAALETTSPR